LNTSISKIIFSWIFYFSEATTWIRSSECQPFCKERQFLSAKMIPDAVHANLAREMTLVMPCLSLLRCLSRTIFSIEKKKNSLRKKIAQ
jgi:hypothetical protein